MVGSITSLSSIGIYVRYAVGLSTIRQAPCSRCGKAYLTQSEYCPICGRKMRIKGRNNKAEDVKRIEVKGY